MFKLPQDPEAPEMLRDRAAKREAAGKLFQAALQALKEHLALEPYPETIDTDNLRAVTICKAFLNGAGFVAGAVGIGGEVYVEQARRFMAEAVTAQQPMPATAETPEGSALLGVSMDNNPFKVPAMLGEGCDAPPIGQEFSGGSIVWGTPQ